MRKLLSMNIKWALAIFTGLDIFCVGLGMGVPFFCILLGFPVGWYLARKSVSSSGLDEKALTFIFKGSLITAVITLVLMLAVWSRAIFMVFDPAADLANYGIPLILFEPRASFLGWLGLMIFIAPFLQFLMTLFGAQLTALRLLSKSKKDNHAIPDYT